MTLFHFVEGVPRYFISAIMTLLYMEIIIGKIPRKKFIKGVIVYFIIGQLGQYGIYYTYYNELYFYRSLVSLITFIILPFLIVFTVFEKKNRLKGLFTFILVNLFQHITIIFSIFFNSDKGSYTIYWIRNFILTFLPLMTIYLLMKKYKIKFKILELFKSRVLKLLIIIYFVFQSVIAYLPYIYWEKYNEKIMPANAYLITIITPIIFFLIILVIYGYSSFSQKNKKLKENMQLQQEEYIKSLESMQEDIRKYNHDYKNLLTGALLQAEEGDYEGVQNYLQDVLDEFELKLGKQISKNTQLKKINSNELKGLLLSKMSEMEDKGIEFHLEVLNEVDKINMKSTDLVRCLGILLDKAIEEVEKLEEKIISLVILQEENITTIMVKNPVTEKVNIQSIYEDNFSTKGEKRGLGLSNYREIIENYENIVRETICTEEEFNQVLKIG